MNHSPAKKVHRSFVMKFLLILIQRLKYKINLDRKNYILKYIRRNKPKTILEIGVFNGAFAKRMLLNATNSLNENISYTGVDLFEDLSSEVHKKEISLWASKKKFSLQGFIQYQKYKD